MSQVYRLYHTPIEPGATLIEASAGSGKTYTIAGLVLRLLVEQEIDIGKILVVTFTIAAADELKNRIRTRLREAARLLARGPAPGNDVIEDHDPELAGWLQQRDRERAGFLFRDALLRYDELNIATIHGFCKRALEESAFETGQPFDAGFIEADGELVLRAAQDFWRARFYGGGPLLAALAAEKRWTPESFVDDFRDAHRYPDTRLEPEPRDLDEALARVEEALASLRPYWDRDGLRDLLDRDIYTKSKGSPFADIGLSLFLDRLEALIAGDYTHIATLARLTREKLTARLAKRSKAQAAQKEQVLAFPLIAAIDEAGIDALLDEVALQLRLAFIGETKRRFEALKERELVWTFDDLLVKLRDALSDRRRGETVRQALRDRYGAALIDEFQDTDLLQYDIFRRLFGDRFFFLIGDPKQAIYSFRGADVHAYLEAKREARRDYTLDQNWRSHSKLVRAVNALFLYRADPFVHEEIPFIEVHGAGLTDQTPLVDKAGDGFLTWRCFTAANGKTVNKAEAVALVSRATANEIARLLDRTPTIGDDPVHPGDIAVLTRTNDQARAVQDALREAGLPSVIAEAGDVFRSEETAELRLILAAVLEPQREAALHAALSTFIWGLNAAQIHRLRSDEAARQKLAGRCIEYRQIWRQRGFMSMLQTFIAREGARARLLAKPDGERRLTNLLHIAELMHRRAVETRLAPEGLLRWLESELARPVHEEDARQLRLESDAAAVQIVTIHKAKGLEYPIVFCPFLWHARPKRGSGPTLVHEEGRQVVYDCGSPRLAARQQQAERERLAEDLRLAYVALTRARQRCVLYWGDFYSAGQSALAHLLNGYGAKPPECGRLPGALVSANPELMTLAELSCEPQAIQPRASDEGSQATLEPLLTETPASRFDGWRMASFTLFARARESERPDHVDPAEPADGVVVETAPAEIFAFAKGARAGVCLHDVFERVELAEAGSEPARTAIDDILARHDLLSPARHPHPLDPGDAVHRMFDRVCRTTVPGLGASFAEIPKERRLHEWSFYLPMAAIRPNGLAEIFGRFGSPRVRRDYAPLAAALSAREIHGFLNGFVDLCCERQGRWHVVDWKSNHLGMRAQDYGEDAMWRAMCGHHYVLQLHLYLLALHRHLRSRLPDYDIDRHLGGAVYVFLRGVDGSAERGWFTDRPTRPLIEALDAFFAGKEAVA